MATYDSFKELDCWKRCRELKIWVNEFRKDLPKNEFDIHDNLKRAARSTTRNIAEGFGRFHYKENIQFCRISRGSLFEVIDDLDNCVLEGYVSEIEIKKGEQLAWVAIRSVNGYISYLKRKLSG